PQRRQCLRYSGLADTQCRGGRLHRSQARYQHKRAQLGQRHGLSLTQFATSGNQADKRSVIGGLPSSVTATTMDGPTTRRSLPAASDQGAPMQVPAQFEYQRATSVEDALSLLTRHGPESRVLAGGHSLIPMMKLRLAEPELLIDINDLAELAQIRIDGSELRIRAI